MFIDFYKTIINSYVEIYDLNALHSDEIKKIFIEDILKLAQFEKKGFHHLIKYKTKKRLKDIKKTDDEKETSLKRIPEYLLEASDYVFSFDLFSTHLIVHKYEDEKNKNFIEERWNNNIDRMNKT